MQSPNTHSGETSVSTATDNTQRGRGSSIRVDATVSPLYCLKAGKDTRCSVVHGKRLTFKPANVKESGPSITIRHPLWTEAIPRQDIPILVLTTAQWNEQEQLSFGAAPFGPGEMAHNGQFVFALPARYNYAFPLGYEEVEKILRRRPFRTFQPKNTSTLSW
jgi:hypothetical protein